MPLYPYAPMPLCPKSYKLWGGERCVLRPLFHDFNFEPGPDAYLVYLLYYTILDLLYYIILTYSIYLLTLLAHSCPCAPLPKIT